MATATATSRATPLRVILGAVLVLGVLSMAPLMVLALIHHSAPNVLDSPFGHTLMLVPTLFDSNPMAALKIVVSQPVAVIAHVEPGTGLRVWEVYLHLLPLLILLAAALVASRLMLRGLSGAAQIAPCAGGLVLLALALNTIRVAACCTAPGWGPDIWLRGLALSPPLGGLEWGELYPQIERFILPAQIFIAGAGATLILIAGESQRDSDAPSSGVRRKRA
jgi:predicted small secreted protein